MVPNLSTLESSPGHESVEYDLDALDVSGRDHKARCRLEISFVPAGPSAPVHFSKSPVALNHGIAPGTATCRSEGKGLQNSRQPTRIISSTRALWLRLPGNRLTRVRTCYMKPATTDRPAAPGCTPALIRYLDLPRNRLPRSK